ncbi:hypothetical protein VTO42DRAFT_6605 [Malbranchea cinnamomea]
MLYIPPEVQANWPEPNYEDPVTRGPGLIIIVLTFHVLATIMVALRSVTRLFITLSFGLDDVLTIIALIPTTGVAATVLLANMKYGWDRHIWDLVPENVKPGIQLGFAGTILFSVAAGLCRLALCAFYYRLLPSRGTKIYPWVIWGFASFSSVGSIVFVFWLAFLCKPAKAYFDFVPPLYEPPYPYSCRSRYVAKLTACVLNVFCDLFTVLLPMPLVWRLRLPLRQRLIVIATFGLGAAVVVVSALKTKYLVASVRDSYDEQWDAYPLWICGIIELDTSLICASAPALRPLVTRYFPNALGTIRMTYRRSSPPGLVEAAAAAAKHAAAGLQMDHNNRDSDQSLIKLQNQRHVQSYSSMPLTPD